MDFCVFQLVKANHVLASKEGKKAKCNKKLDKLLSKYGTIFRDELPSGLSPRRSIDHSIKVEDGIRPRSRPLFQLSPAELLAVKD